MLTLTIIDSRKEYKSDDTVDRAKCLNINLEPAEMRGGIPGDSYWMLVQRRDGGPLAGQAFYLNDNFDWILGLDEDGAIVLVPQTK